MLGRDGFCRYFCTKYYIMRTLCLSICLLLSATAFSQQIPADLEGKWLGKINAGIELRLVLNFTIHNDSLFTTLDSPDQGVNDIPTSSTTYTAGSNEIQVEIPLIKAQFKGVYTAATQSISGVFIQGAPMPMTLTKVTEVKGIVRPQEPVKPYPYKEEEVTFKNKQTNDVTLAGTLTIPEGKGPFTAVILVTGSGPQDRNEALLGHKPFLVLSDYFTRKGIIVLRYDDRGVAQSTGDHGAATTADFASDANAAVDYLLSRKDLNIGKIGIAGHSEGGVIAPLAASKNKQIDFIVLLAGTGIPGDSILNLQADLIARAMGAPEDALQATEKYRRDIINIAKANDDPAMIKSAIIAYNKNLIKNSSAEYLNLLSMTETDTLAAVNFYANAWMHYFLNYDPQPTLRKLKIPVLAVNGTHDLQVPYKENLSAIEAALKEGKNKQYSTMAFDGLNHLFQQSATGSPSEYSHIEETFNEQAMEAIATWILTLK